MLFLGLSSPSLRAQNIESSPLSRYGFGTEVGFASTPYRAMGGVGIALRDQQVVNFLNPAALSTVDSTSYLLDVGVTAELKFMRSSSERKRTFLPNVDYIAMQFPIFKKIGLGLGIKPIFRSGYNISSVANVTGSKDLKYTQKFSGKGSFQNLYMAIGAQLIKGWSLGIRANYIFGHTLHEVYSIPSSSLVNKRYESETLRLNHWSIDFGTQLELQRADNRFGIGAIFSPSLQMAVQRQHSINDNFGDALRPAVQFKDSIIKTKTPMTLGLGLAYSYKNKLSSSIDIKLLKWGSVPNSFKHQNIALKDSYRFAIGGAYVKEPESRSYGDRIKYRAGISYRTPYMTHKSYGEKSTLGLAMGLGLPLKVNDERDSYLNLSLEYLKDIGSSLGVKEDLIKLSLSLNFNETWFRKLKIY